MKNIFDIKLVIFLAFHFLAPLIFLLGFIFALEYSGADIGFGRQFYNEQLVTWPLRGHWLTETGIYKGGRLLFVVALVVISLLLLSSWFYKAVKPYRKELLYMIIAIVTGPVIITILKDITHIYCPWDITIFGGVQPYIRIIDPVPLLLDVGHCFPSANAGFGYSFVSLYFFLLATKPQYKFYGLFVGLGLGLLFGVAQQMRGEHLLSHDVMSLLICWVSSLFWFVVFYLKQLKWIK